MSELLTDSMVIGDSVAAKTRPTVGVLYQKIGTDSFGNPLLKKINSNTVVVGGAILALQKLVKPGDVAPKFIPQTLNHILGINDDTAGSNPDAEKIALFGAGTGGAQLDWGSIIAPNIRQDNIIDLVPMRYCQLLSGEEASKYFMKTNPDDEKGFSKWYLKEFDGAPVIKSCWKNAVDSASDSATEIVGSTIDPSKSEGIETFAEFQFTLNTKDIREWFENSNNISMARYNTFGFYTGEKGDTDTEYKNVRLYAVVTFNNRDLTLESSSTFIYRVYSLV